MNLIDRGISYIKKLCDDDEVCVMLVFVLIGFMFCYLFKNRISGFMNFATIEHEFDSLLGGPVDSKVDPVKPPQQVQPQQVQPQQVQPQQVQPQQVQPPKQPQMNQGVKIDQKPVGIELKPRKPDDTPSTAKQLEVMAAKPPVKRDYIEQMPGLQIQDASIFKPFDEVWNPGFMPLDMVFKGVPSQMAPDRPMGDAPPMPPKQQLPVVPKQPMGQDRPMPPQQGAQGPPKGGEVNLVLVYAPWCGYSKKMLPDYEKIKAEFDGKTINGKKINIIMYNSDVDKDKVKEYQVEGFPTLFLEKDGNRENFPHREYDKIKASLESL